MLQRIALSVLICISATGPLTAQWKLINPLPTNNNLNDMIFLNPLQGAAVGMNGTILITSDGGNRWKPVPYDSFTNLNSIASPNSVNLFVCGDNGLIFRANAKFSQIDTIESGNYGNLNKIAFLDHQTGFCMGNDRVILKTTDAGMTWSPSYAGYPCDLCDFSFPDDSTGFALGRYYVPFSAYSSVLVKTKNQGNTWELVDSLMFDDVRTVCFTDSLTGFLGSYDIQKTTDGGRTWVPDTISEYLITDIEFENNQIGWAISYEGYLVKTDDGGGSWTRIADNGSSNHILIYNPDAIYTFGYGGDIWYSRDGGDQWTRTGKGDKNQLSVIEFTDKDTGYILGDSVLYRTNDAGNTWKMERHPVGNLDDAAFANSNRCMALAWNGVWLSVDACNSWHKVDVSLPRAVLGCAFADNQTAYITGVDYGHFFANSVILKSTDGGETWLKDSLPGYPIIREMYFMPDGDGFALGFSGGLYKTTNAGKTWVNIEGTASRFGYRTLFFPSPTSGYAIGVRTEMNGAVYNQICKTVDSGDNWTSVYLDDQMFGPELSGLYFINESTGYVTTTGGRILKTTDGGTTWTEDFSANWLSGINGIGDHIWAIGWYGTIVTTNTKSWISDGISNPDIMHEMYPITAITPNPFRDKTDIALMIDRGGPVNITITDLSGHRVGYYSGNLPGGEFTWTFDGHHLLSGVYILSVSSGNLSGHARILKINLE